MIFNMNSGIGKKIPILDEAYPQNVTNNIGDVSTFEVKIKEEGKPAAYTYQWYMNDDAVAGGTGPIFTCSPKVGSYTVYCIVTNEAGSVKSRVVTLTVNTLYVFQNGSFPLGGGYNGVVTDSDSEFDIQNGLWRLNVNGTGSWGATWATVPVNVDRKNRLIFAVAGIHPTGGDPNIAYGYFGLADGSNLGNLNMVATTNLKLYESGYKEISVDVSNLSGDYYVKIVIDRTHTAYHQEYIYISSIRFE